MALQERCETAFQILRAMRQFALSLLLVASSALALSNTNPPALPGLAEADLLVNLRQAPLNMRFSAGQQMRLAFSRCGKGNYGGNQIEVCFDRLDGKIVVVNAAVYGLDAAAGQEFLAYLASLPIAGVSQQVAKSWVEQTYPKIRQGKPAEKLFGKIKFELIGTNAGAMSLRVANKDYIAWALKRLN